MINLKNWKTDIKIKWPRIHLIKGKQIDIAAEEIVKSILKYSFWFLPFGCWKIYELIKPYLEAIQ